MEYTSRITDYAAEKADVCRRHDDISKELFQEYGVNMGLRDDKGRDVLTGLTNISEIMSFDWKDGKKVPCGGELLYRGIDVKELAKGSLGEKFIFKEAAYLLLFSELPSQSKLTRFQQMMEDIREHVCDYADEDEIRAHLEKIMAVET